MNLTLLTPPAIEPFTVDEAKALARTAIGSGEHDALVARLITAARQQVEEDTGRAIGLQTWRGSQTHWPRARYLTLPVCPLVSVERFTYRTSAGVQTLDLPGCSVQPQPHHYGQIALAAGGSWPAAVLLYPGLTVDFTCGYQTIPPPLKEAIGALLTYWYDNPEAAIASTAYKAEVGVLPLRYHELIAPFKLWGRR